MDQETKQQLKNVIEKNEHLINKMLTEKWDIKYQKDADMFIIGNNFPIGSFYFYVNGSGVMLRIDDKNIIYGIAIENGKYFLKQNPEFNFIFYPIIYPFKYKFLQTILPPLFDGANKLKQYASITNYIAGELVYG